MLDHSTLRNRAGKFKLEFQSTLIGNKPEIKVKSRGFLRKAKEYKGVKNEIFNRTINFHSSSTMLSC